MQLKASILLLTSVSASSQNLNNQHRTPSSGWFGRRRRTSSKNDDLSHQEVLKASSTAMHSFTGAEGIDHKTVATSTDERRDVGKDEEKQDTTKIEGSFLAISI